jgi:hypothetical protein
MSAALAALQERKEQLETELIAIEDKVPPFVHLLSIKTQMQ